MSRGRSLFSGVTAIKNLDIVEEKKNFIENNGSKWMKN